MLRSAIAEIETTIRRSVLVVTYDLVKVQLSANTGYVEGAVIFTNSARLLFFEFWQRTALGTERKKYRYHLLDDANQMIFRYDNAPHHPEIATFPHHKHLSTSLVDSVGPRFVDVFAEVEAYALGIN